MTGSAQGSLKGSPGRRLRRSLRGLNGSLRGLNGSPGRRLRRSLRGLKGSLRGRPEEMLNVLRDERGSVEAGLTLIPLTILFLLSVQLVFASQWGNWQRVTHQSATDLIAISGNEGKTLNQRDRIRHEPLIGGGYLVIAEREEPIPLLANFAALKPSSATKSDKDTSQSTFIYKRVVTALSEVFTQ